MLTLHARKLALVAAGTVAAGTIAAGLTALPAAANARTSAPAAHYAFHTYNSSNDETFNQLLGINSHGLISGYFGSGAQGHKNKGYLLSPPYHQSDYVVENFPGSAQTQVTGLNNAGTTVGFFSHTNKANPAHNANFGFYRQNGQYHEVNFPTSDNSAPPVNQLLGVNSSDIAVGFYNDSAGNARGYMYNIGTGTFTRIKISGAVSLTATGINNLGDVTGFFNDATGPVMSFLLTHTGHLYTFVSGGNETQAFGVNDSDEAVGAITIGSSTFGFTWTPSGGFHHVNDPKGMGSTVVNGVNDAGDLVGFYTDGKGNVDGMLATP